MRFWFLTFFAFCLSSNLVLAQVTPAPTAPTASAQPQTTPLPTPVAQNLRIIVLGDGLAGGMGAGLTRMAEEGEAIYVENRFDETSGFTRPEAFSWVNTVASLPPDSNFNTAIILSGINDKREFRKGADRFVFGTPEWKVAFAAEVGLFLDTLKAKNLKPYWVSQPPMQNLTFDTEMQLLNSIYKTSVEAKGGVYIDIRKPFLDANGQYTDRGPDLTGAIRKLRSRDGITFFKNGNNLLASIVLEAVQNGVPAPSTAPAPTSASIPTPSAVPTPSVPSLVPAAPLPTAPLFAQAGTNGVDETLLASNIKILKSQSSERKTSLAAGELGDLTPLKGTASEKLYATGEAGSAPAGRFDDFTISP